MVSGITATDRHGIAPWPSAVSYRRGVLAGLVLHYDFGGDLASACFPDVVLQASRSLR